MKNIFKTALSVILALAVILVPMTVLAATGDSEEPWQLQVTTSPSMRLAVTVAPGETQWVQAADMNGTVEVGYATGDYMLMYGRMPTYPETESGNYTASLVLQGYDIFSVYNPSETDNVTVYMTLAAGIPVDNSGTMENPKEVTLSSNMFGGVGANEQVELDSGNDGYWYSCQAPSDGALTVSIGAFDAEYNSIGWMYNVNNTTKGTYGDTHLSDEEEPAYYETVDVDEGDIITVFASTYESGSWTNPAGIVTVDFSFDAVGSSNCPEVITETGDYTASITEGSWGYFYSWTANEEGTATITVNNENGWQYVVNNVTSGIYGDTHLCDDEPIVTSESVEVAAGDELQIMVVTYDPDAWSAPAGTISWTLDFEGGDIGGGNEGGGDIGGGNEGGGDIGGGGDEEPNYSESTTPLVVGTEIYDTDMMYTYTVYTFTPDETGSYTFTSTDSLIGIAGYNWVNGNPSDETINSNTFVWDCTDVGQSIMVAALPDTNVATITITRDELDISDEVQWTVYENTALTEEATLDGEQADVEYVDTTDDVEDKAVLGEDGFYHLGTADGPVLFVNVNDKETMSLVNIILTGKLTAVYYEGGEVSEKYDFTGAVLEYLGIDDLEVLGEIGDNEVLFPLTADLMKIYQMVGETNGWYGADGFVGGELDDAWMFACCYNEDITVWGNASTGGSGTGSTSNSNTGSTGSNNSADKEVDKNSTSPVTGDSAVALAVAMAAAAVLVIKTKKIAE